MTGSTCGKQHLLDRAKQGQTDSLGELLDAYRNYLYLIARTQIDLHLSVRASPSDIVQETFLQATKEMTAFRGETEVQFQAWLRKILVHNIVAAYNRHIRAEKRNVQRTLSLNEVAARVDHSSLCIEKALAAPVASPSSEAEQREMAARAADALAALPAAYREVIILRNLEGLPYDQIAGRMGRTSAAVRKLWARAIQRLKLPDPDDEEIASKS